jgi:hypothetical protein
MFLSFCQVLKMSGADSKKVVFLFTDEQIKDESFLEDLSMVLNTGEVPNLFATEEKTEILERVQVSFILYCLGLSLNIFTAKNRITTSKPKSKLCSKKTFKYKSVDLKT